MGKLMVIEFEDDEKTLFEKVISVIGNEMLQERQDFVSDPVLSYPGLEIRQHQRRVLRNGSDINLTRLEYGTLVYLASYPGWVLSKQQIFEEVWNMDSNSCFAAVCSTISRLRAKIEKDRKNPVYIKTVQDGYKFDVKSIREMEVAKE